MTQKLPPPPLPRGIRNRNPGNIRLGDEEWRGQVAEEDVAEVFGPDFPVDDEFCMFIDPVHGLRAIFIILRTYSEKDDLKTVRDIVSRWSATDLSTYIPAVAHRAGVGPDQEIDPTEQGIATAIATAIVMQENGSATDDYPENWYPPETYIEAYELAYPGRTVIS